jgi:hypothetical protein
VIESRDAKDTDDDDGMPQLKFWMPFQGDFLLQSRFNSEVIEDPV